MGKHRKPKSTPRHRKPVDNKAAKKVATFGAAAVSVPTLALTFTPSAQAATTGNIPRVVIPAEEGATDPSAAACPDYIVQRGDTLSGIAARADVALDVLEPLNPGIIAGDRPDDYSLIFKGGHVHLPAGHCTVHPVKTHVHHGWHKHGHAVYYRDCEAAPAGLHKGQPGYRAGLDGDGDGKACEGPWPPAPVTTPPSDDGGSVTPPPPTGTTPVIAPDCPGTASGYCAHSVSFWAPLIEQAKSLVGVSYSTSAIESLMLAESSGDPNAVNLSDSNAANGTPSKGLMQVIQPTFDANHVSGTSSNIYDPLANIAAALQYIKVTYGYVPNSPY